MGGRPLTMTVEGRERYPVRVRYARDYRDDVEALKSILVSARGHGRRQPGASERHGDGGPTGRHYSVRRGRSRSRSRWPSWPTSGWSKGRR